MPHTHTDDIAPVLPSSIDGPFQIVDPSAPGSWFKAEPANGRLAVAGDARPQRSLAIGYNRTYLSAASSYIGNAIPAHYVGSSWTGGFYATPLHLPKDMDVSAPCSVKVCVTPQYNADTNGQVACLALACTRVTLGGTASESNFSYDWDIPDNWSTSDVDIILLDNGNGRSYEADTFTEGDLLGLRLSRDGSNPIDTFNKSIKFAHWLMLEYTAKTL